LVACLDPAMASDYRELKRLVLHEFRSSSNALLDKYYDLTRGLDETFTLFASRLKAVFMYYMSRAELIP